MNRIFLLLCLVALAPAAWAQKPPMEIPRDDALVIERLPAGYVSPPARDTAPSLEQVRALMAAASRNGDARLASRAEALLPRLARTQPAETIWLLQAYAAQHRHDFAGALAVLDRLLARHPADADARHLRAQIHLVGGRLDRAKQDCTALALGIDSRRALLCFAALAERRHDTRQGIALLTRWLSQASATDPSRTYALTLRAEFASMQSAGDADLWFRQALATQPEHVGTLAAYARHLRRNGEFAQAWDLLRDAPDADRLLLEQALLARALNRPDAGALARRMQQRYRLAHAVGAAPEAREEAEFALSLGADAPRALQLAQSNFATQRDREDVELFCRAAIAAGETQTLQSLRRWAASQQLLPTDDGCPRA